MINASVIIFVIEGNIVSWKLRKGSRRKNRRWLQYACLLGQHVASCLGNSCLPQYLLTPCTRTVYCKGERKRGDIVN
jgi:hypothetical protein